MRPAPEQLADGVWLAGGLAGPLGARCSADATSSRRSSKWAKSERCDTNLLSSRCSMRCKVTDCIGKPARRTGFSDDRRQRPGSARRTGLSRSGLPGIG
jgi:hypothetical protein